MNHRLIHPVALSFLLCLAACGGGEPITKLAGEGQALTSCTQGPMVPGLDVSHDQGTVDWSQVKANGFDFAFAKATEGLTIQDPDFATNWSGMKSAGVIRGAYHFFHPQDDGTKQAQAYLAEVGTLEPGDLLPMLDWEVDDCSGGTGCPSSDATKSGCYSIADQISQAQAFINEISTETGLTTIIYTYPSFWNCLDNPSQAAAYPLWQAEYVSTATTTSITPPSGNCPSVLSPWKSWTLWQWTANGSTSGIQTGPIDFDVFNGTLAQLAQFEVPSPTVDAGTPPPEDAGTSTPDAGGPTAPAPANNSCQECTGCRAPSGEMFIAMFFLGAFKRRRKTTVQSD